MIGYLTIPTEILYTIQWQDITEGSKAIELYPSLLNHILPSSRIVFSNVFSIDGRRYITWTDKINWANTKAIYGITRNRKVILLSSKKRTLIKKVV